MRKYFENVKRVADHVKRNSGTYIIIGIFMYLFYQVMKMVCDTGKTKPGECYYESLDEKAPPSEE